MVRAGLRVHQNIVELMLSRGANDFKNAMEIASCNGQVHIVRLMLDRGANSYNEVLSIADSQGHPNIVELIRERMNSPSS